MFADELRRVYRRPRNLVILLLVAVVPVLLGIVVKVGGGPRHGGGPPFFAEITQNAVFLPVAALASMEALILPLSVAIVSGDALAGDAANGSLRYLLVRKLGRVSVLNAKAVSALVFTLTIAAVIAGVGLVLGFILFPGGQLITLSGQAVSTLTGVFDVVLAALLVGVSMFSVAMVGLAVSSLTSSSLAAASIALTVAIACEVISAIPQLSAIRPALLSNYWGSYVDLFRSPMVLGGVFKDLLEQAGWSALFYAIAVITFSRRDILT